MPTETAAASRPPGRGLADIARRDAARMAASADRRRRRHPELAARLARRRPPRPDLPGEPLSPRRAHPVGQPVVRRPLDPRLQRHLSPRRGSPRPDDDRRPLGLRSRARLRPPRRRPFRPVGPGRIGPVRRRAPPCNSPSASCRFSLGEALALGACWAAARRRWPLAVVLGLLATLSSPLAGAFLGLGLAAWLLAEWPKRAWRAGC